MTHLSLSSGKRRVKTPVVMDVVDRAVPDL